MNAVKNIGIFIGLALIGLWHAFQPDYREQEQGNTAK